MKGFKNKKDIDQDYISLQDAAIICSYSQEYLSLRARQGKLKAVKFGRNWVTTKDWLQEYLRTIDDYNVNHVSDKVLKKKLKVKAKPKKKPKKPKVKIKPKEVIPLAAPPANLPVSQFPNIRLGKLRPAFVAVLTLVLIVTGGVFGNESFIKTYNDLMPILENANKNFERNIVREFQTIDQIIVQINRAGDFMIEDAAQSLVYVSQDIKDIGQSMLAALTEIKSLPGFFPEYVGWFNQKQSIASKWMEDKISQGSSGLGRIFSGSGKSLSSLYFTVNKFVADEIFVLAWIITDGGSKVNNFFDCLWYSQQLESCFFSCSFSIA